MQSADLDKASDGVWRSAFGAQGQKCSACSRVYVHKSVRDEFVRLLVEKTKKIKIGNPLEKDVWLGPVINEGAVKTFEDAVAQGREGWRAGAGRRQADHAGAVQSRLLRRAHRHRRRARRITPCSRRSTSSQSPRWPTSLSLDEAIELANRSEYGLTAGIFSEERQEIETFFNRIEAGVTYANRRSGATTGAWPGINPFGGWKASGSSGRGTGGPYYVQQFMREQSRVVME